MHFGPRGPYTRGMKLARWKDPLLCAENLVRDRQGPLVVYRPAELSLDEVLDVLLSDGESLKEGRKGTVRLVGDCVVKESSLSILDTFKRTAQRSRYRQAWLAAHQLRTKGIAIPEPYAFIEHRHLGVISGHAMISAYLQDQRNVEHFAVGLCQRGAGLDTLALFLEALARSLNALSEAGAYHADLSGKNIYTQDGAHFTFIDLDAVQLGVAYTPERRLKNHIQLYDSFCDFIHERLLVPFIAQLLPPDIDARLWLPKVRAGQEKRRRQLEARYARRGEVRPHPLGNVSQEGGDTAAD